MTSTHIELITSDKNQTVKLAKALLTQARQRKKQGQTVIEGIHLMDAALRSDYPLVQVLLAQSAHSHPEVQQLLARLPTYTSILTVADSLYASFRSLGAGVDIMAIIDIPAPALPTIDHDCLILNDVQDSGNVGPYFVRPRRSVSRPCFVARTPRRHGRPKPYEPAWVLSLL